MPTYRSSTLAFLTVAAAGLALAQAPATDTVADIEERTRPFGQLCLKGQDCGGEIAPAAAVDNAAARSGEEVYAAHCHICHATGLNDAPKFADAEAWAPRLAQGAEELLRITKEGLNTMPPMGTCMSCTDAELSSAINYMTSPPES